MRDGRVTGIESLQNAETPEFFDMVTESGMFDKWTGMTVEEARNVEVDGVSGATLSSGAVIATVRRGLEYAATQRGIATAGAGLPADIRKTWTSPKFLCALLVVVMGGVLPLFIRSRRYRIAQLVLNVIVLGLWSGVFFRWMDYELFSAFLFRQAAPAVIGVAVGFILLSCVVQRPYCRFVCPTGNLFRISQNIK